MRASILDLRYRMKDVLSALDRNESVDILYHGKLKGTILPHNEQSGCSVTEHPFFGMSESLDVEKQMNELRSGRYRDL